MCGEDAPADGGGSEVLTKQVKSSFCFDQTSQIFLCFLQAREQDMLSALVDVRARRTELGRSDRQHASDTSGRSAVHPSRFALNVT